MHETLDDWSKDMLDFVFSEKDLGIYSPQHFENVRMIFQEKIVLLLYSIN